ncbi:MAG TPA: tetratricopeptide repeat protein [Rhodocyclaceae bacterium]|nr:tetratricopeptide repeat protein [Rhodocyclaceae bacterium]
MEALALQEAGELADAEVRLREALSFAPDRESILINLSGLLISQTRFEEAQTYCLRAVEINPYSAEAWLNLGLCRAAEQQSEEAAKCFENVLLHGPRNVMAHTMLARIHCAAKRYEKAMVHAEQLFELNPQSAETHRLQGLALIGLQRFDQALAAHQRALELAPDWAEAWMGCGNVLCEMRRPEEALNCYERALVLQPDDAEIHHNLGNAHGQCGRFDEAIACYNRALALQADSWLSIFNRGFARLALGDYRAGFADYETRWQTGKQRPHGMTGTLWRGEDIQDKRLLVHAEQGFGDMIQFGRLITEVARRGAHVQLGVHPHLVSLMKSLAGVERVSSSKSDLQPYDFHCPIMSLPYALGIDLKSLPGEVPYIDVPANYRDKWASRCKMWGRPRVGLAWSSSEKAPYPVRSMPLRTLQALASIDAVFVSLQKEYSDEDRADLSDMPWLMDMSSELDDFSDTAALISQLDIVISVDTVVAHLAGALAKPLWILLPHVAEWRWLVDRKDSPWYPSARLFRQPKPGDWNGVVNEMVPMLRKMLDSLHQ